ncbi:MAG TPA: hypothetical protein PLK58_14535, partial [Candidatus Rifleibacterium sp.]|nr:hypothetical protein [Candidatus Rifleibacterium sp.]
YINTIGSKFHDKKKGNFCNSAHRKQSNALYFWNSDPDPEWRNLYPSPRKNVALFTIRLRGFLVQLP